MKDIYLLASRIQSLCGMDPYKDPPAHEGTKQAIVIMIREFMEGK